ncbi:MAG: hypothetical protein ISR97_04145 [Nitrospira sp.]|nr:hypothetical protein [Nitrospira sp.]
MKYIYMIMLLAATLIYTNALAQPSSAKPPKEMPVVAQQQELLMDCNLAARNSLISGDIKKVEETCTKAVNEMTKSFPNKGYMINPMLNLAFTYSLTGDFDKADPLLAKAKLLGEKFYESGGSEMKSINDFITDHNKRKGKPATFDKNGVVKPH